MTATTPTTRSRTASAWAWIRDAAGSAKQTVVRHNAVIILLLAMFIARLFLADWNSYWNDEVLSAYIYGSANDSLIDAIRKLANNSIHPPLYQTILYIWMGAFGPLEAATRTLSNLYVTGAGIFLYATVNLAWSRSIAFFATAAYSVAALTTEYGLETRSYAQTMLLVSLSSYLLIRLLLGMRSSGEWTLRGRWVNVVLIVGANAGLALTHYYNIFWLIAQGAFALVFVLVGIPRGRRIRGALVVAGVALAAPVIFLAVWGRFFFAQFQSRVDEYSTEGAPARTPVHLLYNALLQPNIAGELVGSLAVSAVVLVLAVLAIATLVRRGPSEATTRAWSVIHLVWWLVMPLVTVYSVFTLLGVERYQGRYFIFSFPPLPALLMIAVAGAAAYLLRGRSESTQTGVSAVAMLLVAVIGFLPGGYSAGTLRKTDWRGNAQRIVSVVESDTTHDYVLIEPSFGSSSRADYYLERFSDEVRVDLSIPTRMESGGEFSDLEALLDSEDPDRVIVIFNHLSTTRFPNLIAYMDDRYDLVISQFDESDRRAGYMLYERAEEENPVDG